ncbi:MAG: hypothetical protein PWQ57_2327 [Desulfovibrionales bacterium]|jgi:DNA-binding NtrC family response regulator|nr:hypothetical protein [Desulfovibrionales bacterium]
MSVILVFSKDPGVCRNVTGELGARHEIVCVDALQDCLEALRRERPNFVLVDLDMIAAEPAHNRQNHGFKAELAPFWEANPQAEVVVLCRPERIRDAVAAVKAGAGNYLTTPLHPEELKYVLESLLEARLLQSEVDALRDGFWRSEASKSLSTASPLMREVLEKVRLVAPARTTVLLEGETGTGKGVVAQLIHLNSAQRDGPFIHVHCGAIPETLVESELFGHEKGAFTGAVRRKVGKFEQAEGGTIFLDEIGTVSKTVQVKLLRVLQDRVFERVGGEQTITANVRVIAASNLDLKKMCDDGEFRSDLYYRLNVFSIVLPPLRERTEDIPLLVKTFLQRLNRLYPKEISSVSNEALGGLARYAWPGNVRELENVVERAFILEPSRTLTAASFPAEVMAGAALGELPRVDASLSLHEYRARVVEQAERRYLDELLAAHRGRVDKTAREAGVGPRQLNNLMKKYGLNKKNYK